MAHWFSKSLLVHSLMKDHHFVRCPYHTGSSFHVLLRKLVQLLYEPEVKFNCSGISAFLNQVTSHEISFDIFIHTLLALKSTFSFVSDCEHSLIVESDDDRLRKERNSRKRKSDVILL